MVILRKNGQGVLLGVELFVENNDGEEDGRRW